MDLSLLGALLGIIWVDLILSGDNAIVIAMAVRNLEPRQRELARWAGTAVAVALRIVGALFAGHLMATKGLAAVCGIALLWIAIKLLAGGDDEHKITAKATLAGAIGTIAMADASMSLDNVIAVAGMSGGHWWLMAFGIIVSIPIVVAGSALLSGLLTRFPILVWAGSGVLGWAAGGIIAHDPWLAELVGVEHLSWLTILPFITTALVLVVGFAVKLAASRAEQEDELGEVF